MEKPTNYCDAIAYMNSNDREVHKFYHDKEYGFPLTDDNALFGRLILEINQAGLSWTTILHKQENFRKAYQNFSIKKIAAYKEKDFERLMNDAGIIRNRLKINAAIENAKTILQIQKQEGSFYKWLTKHHPQDKAAWVKLFKQTFKFTGGEIVGEFLMSIGFLPGAHVAHCAIYKKILKTKPLWLQKTKLVNPKTEA